jgi:hypothetical protein
MTRLSLLITSVLLTGFAACTGTSPDEPGNWGSDQASLSVVGTNATLLLLASGGCYGSYSEFDPPPASGTFSLPATFTQLIGAFPGKVEYAAQVSGTVERNQITLTITVPSLPATLGPFLMIEGAAEAWPACQYP